MGKVGQFLRSSRRGRPTELFIRTLKLLLKIGTTLDLIISSNRDQYDLSKLDLKSSRVFVYVHHSKSGLLDEFDEKVLKEAKMSGYSTILVSNGKIRNITNADFLIRKNRFGRDFSVMRDAARSLRFKKDQKIDFFYLNNSMIWQDNAITNLIKKFESSESNTVIFPTESFHPIYHVQPYFLYVRLDKEKLIKFSSSFEWVKNLHFRRSIIYFNEYRIAQKLVQNNWKIQVIAPYWEVLSIENKIREMNNEPLLDSNFKFYNPNQHLWKSLSLFQINGVKRSLIYQNPVDIKNSPCCEEDALKGMHVHFN